MIRRHKKGLRRKVASVQLSANKVAPAAATDNVAAASAVKLRRSLQEDIRAEQARLDQARQEADAAERQLAQLKERLSSQPSDPDDIEAISADVAAALERSNVVRQTARAAQRRLDALEDRLTALEGDAKSTPDATKAQDDVGSDQPSSHRLDNPFSATNMLQWLLDHGPRLIAILLGALIIYLTVKLSGHHMVTIVARGGSRGTLRERENRALTLVGVFQNVASLVVLGGGALMLLDEVGIPILPLMGGAAVLGLAVAFGSQNLIKDYFSGFMVLLEDQYGINDVVKIGDVSGAVEQITLRMTVLRDLEGVVHFIPHGTITTVSNMTHGWSRAVLDIGVAYKEDTDRVMTVMLEVAREMRQDAVFGPMILDDAEMLGVDALGDSAVVVKMLIRTDPLKRWPVRRRVSAPRQASLRRTGHRDPLSAPHGVLARGGGRSWPGEQDRLVERRAHVGFDLVAFGQRIGQVEQAGDCQHFANRFGR